MGPKRRPSGRDCALALATLESLDTNDRLVVGDGPMPHRPGESGAASNSATVRGAALIVNGRDLLAPGFVASAIRLIDLERRARFARVAS